MNSCYIVPRLRALYWGLSFVISAREMSSGFGLLQASEIIVIWFKNFLKATYNDKQQLCFERMLLLLITHFWHKDISDFSNISTCIFMQFCSRNCCLQVVWIVNKLYVQCMLTQVTMETLPVSHVRIFFLRKIFRLGGNQWEVTRIKPYPPPLLLL